MNRLTNYHIIKVSYIGPTNSNPSKVSMRSDRFKQTKVIQYDYEFYGTCEIAQNWLTKNGFDLIGTAEGKDCYYIISTTFKGFKD